MADTSVAITAGSGTSIDTRTEATNGNHRQVIVVGDPSTNAGVAPVDATAGLKVDLGSDNDVNVTQIGGGAITAGAGAVAAGTPRVTLASDDPAVASLSVLDDWDETDRAKVNPIVGQAGVAAGAGAVGATTQRVTLASDDPGVAHLATIAGDTTDIETAVELIDDTVATTGAAIPAKGIAVSGTDGTNARVLKTDSSGELQIDVLTSALPTGASTLAEQQSQTTHLATIAGDTTDIETAVELIDDAIVADDAGFTAATTKVMMAGFVADEASTDSVSEDDAGAARMTLDRKQIVTPQPHTTGGLSTMAATSQDGGTALTNTAQAVKASAGQVYGWYIYNPNDEVSFVNVYNTASGSVTVGTTAPLFHIPVPAGAAANVSFTHGITFGTAISISATKTAGSNTAPDTAMEVVIFYA